MRPLADGKRKQRDFVMIAQMQVKGLMFDPYNNAYIVILRDEDQAEMLPIWVGKPEANAIGLALENVAPPRPMTHDFMKSFLDTYNAKVISVVISDLNENTYFAKIHLMYEDSEYVVDARPSDAIALALRSQAPIFASESVIRKQSSEELEQWLENLKPEDFGKLDS
jgi:bifunctional DNase/RNase